MIFVAFSQCRKDVYYEFEKEEFAWVYSKTGLRYPISRIRNGLHYNSRIESLNEDDVVGVLTEEWEKFTEAYRIDLDKVHPIRNDGVDPQETVQQDYIVTPGTPSYDLCVAADPLIRFIKAKGHPHMSAIVTNDSVELLEGILAGQK